MKKIIFIVYFLLIMSLEQAIFCSNDPLDLAQGSSQVKKFKMPDDVYVFFVDNVNKTLLMKQKEDKTWDIARRILGEGCLIDSAAKNLATDAFKQEWEEKDLYRMHSSADKFCIDVPSTPTSNGYKRRISRDFFVADVTNKISDNSVQDWIFYWIGKKCFDREIWKPIPFSQVSLNQLADPYLSSKKILEVCEQYQKGRSSEDLKPLNINNSSL